MAEPPFLWSGDLSSPTRGELLVILSDKHHIARCPPSSLHLLLNPDPYTKQKDESAQFYEAQCIHYGLPARKTKDAAKKALSMAFAAQNGVLHVPKHIEIISKELKDAWIKIVTADKRKEEAALKAKKKAVEAVKAKADEMKKAQADIKKMQAEMKKLKDKAEAASKTSSASASTKGKGKAVTATGTKTVNKASKIAAADKTQAVSMDKRMQAEMQRMIAVAAANLVTGPSISKGTKSVPFYTSSSDPYPTSSSKSKAPPKTKVKDEKVSYFMESDSDEDLTSGFGPARTAPRTKQTARKSTGHRQPVKRAITPAVKKEKAKGVKTEYGIKAEQEEYELDDDYA